MAVLAFTLLFVALGVGVLFVALSGGPGGARKRMASQSRRTRRIALINFLLAVVILGLGIPAAVIATVNARNDVPEANVSNLTEAEKRGRRAFSERCANCHTLKASRAVAQVGPNLDTLRPPKKLVLDAINRGRARGNGMMAPDLVVGEDAEDVAAYVAKAVGQTTER
jgi:mono/diheme cytochrome c family protein